MDARKVAAQFAAYVCYQESRGGQPSPAEAARFATESWTAFLPVAPEGWGRLLLRVAKAGPAPERQPARKNRPRKRKLAVAI
jgi:hypothetical protein